MIIMNEDIRISPIRASSFFLTILFTDAIVHEFSATESTSKIQPKSAYFNDTIFTSFTQQKQRKFVQFFCQKYVTAKY